jgi:NAD(P)-dependent dehydrogenase (short-subunit alcohol dehydrogenase family)
MEPLFTGRTAVVTGGARGLGFAMATALAEAGARVALLDLRGSAASAELLHERTGADAIGLDVDVTDPDRIGAAFTDLESALGTATVLVNSAGISLGRPALDTTLAEWNAVFAVNVTGTFLTAQAFTRRLVASGTAGTVVNIASMSGIIVNTPQAQCAYNASKAAVTMLTKSLAIEWLPLGIRVNSISPGYFASDMTRDYVKDNPDMAQQWIARIPAGRMGDPAELGDLVVYLASDRSSYVVGQDFVIDGGYVVV